MGYDPWNAYALHEDESATGISGREDDSPVPGESATAAPAPSAAPEDAPREPDAPTSEFAEEEQAESPVDTWGADSPPPEEPPLTLRDEADEGVVVARSPDATALVTAVGRVMDILDAQRHQLDVLRDERREAEQAREAALIEAARLEAELEAERRRRETAELELMKAKRDLYGDEARLRAARLEALVEVEAARRQEIQRELDAVRAALDAGSRKRWWRR